MAKKPKIGSAARQDKRLKNLTYVKNTILDLAKRAEAGSEQAGENLRAWLAKFPDMRNLIRSLDDLAARTEQVWIASLSGDNRVSRMALEKELSNMKAELLGPNPSLTDKLLASTVIVSYFGYQRAARAVALPTDHQPIRTAREKVLDIAQRRLQDALRNWELHSEKKKSHPRSPVKLQLFDPAVG